MPSLAFVIVAAGSSRRMGFDKLASDLAGRPVLAHAIAACSAAEGVEEIWVVTRPERFEWVEELVSSLEYEEACDDTDEHQVSLKDDLEV
ncbi:MAG: NTP transferase domain-containing protein [Verrucomicrobiota bacterium]